MISSSGFLYNGAKIPVDADPTSQMNLIKGLIFD